MRNPYGTQLILSLFSKLLHRAELERQRDFHRGEGIFSWLLRVLPGAILFNVAFALDRPMFALLVELQLAGGLIVRRRLTIQPALQN